MSLYLLINLASVSLPFLFSFHPKIRFDREWKYFFPAVLLTTIFFVAWDSWFTSMGVWGFNPDYVASTSVAGIPIEEILFFICIPYASMFTLHVLRKSFPHFALSKRLRNLISLMLILGGTLIAVLFFPKIYTLTAFLSSTITVLIGHFVLKEKMDHFYLMYALILIPFFIVNGILTGMWIPSEVVWYNNEENLGLRLITIPVEDVFYGMAMLLMTTILSEKLKTI